MCGKPVNYKKGVQRKRLSIGMKLNLHGQCIADIAESEVPERHLQNVQESMVLETDSLSAPLLHNRFIAQEWNEMIHADAVPETSNIYTSRKMTL